MPNKLTTVSSHFIAIILCIVIPFVFISGCSQPQYLTDPVTVTGFKLNTYVSVAAYTTGGHSSSELHDILNNALNICDTYENMLSRTNSNSTLYRINTGEVTTISNEMFTIIERGLYYSSISDGTFDIAIGSVSSLWDFTSDDPHVPDSAAISNALKYVDYTKVNLTQKTDSEYSISMPQGTILDLGSISKGYIADRIREYLISQNITNAIINLGGNVLCVGKKNSSNDFTIAIKKPFSEDGSSIAKLKINNLSVVSSGNYERYFYQDGKLYYHILDPRTGYPFDTNISNVTIISKDSFEGDCLSTTCFALGIDKGMNLIESLNDTEAMFYTNDGKTVYSSGFSTYLSDH